MKKVYLIFIMSFFLFQNLFANTSGDNSYKTIDENLNFVAVLENGVVKTSWDKFTKGDEYGFSYYKVVRSNTKSNPYYPEDGYISYISDINNTSFIDENPYSGLAYYRVCAVSKDKGNYRFCSKVVSINNGESNIKESKPVLKKELLVKKVIKTQKPLFTIEIQEAADNIYLKYINKIEAKNLDKNKKLEIINLIIEKLESIKISSDNKGIIDYLINKFKDYAMSLKNNADSLDNVDKIIDGIVGE